MAPIPPAPQLSPAVYTEVFTYPDPSRPLNPSNPFGNAQRLAFLGDKIAGFVYVELMMKRWPRADTQQFTRDFHTLMERAVAAYQWAYQVHGPFPPNVNPYSPAEAHRIFFTYVGAVAASEGGDQRVKDWFIDLLRALS
ncbi:hypothetical protein BC628DRAFT_1410999 [Trametes gibbosa]|nr:hypothetical protein BC628DRAFT_1410999 [Trametes gibbosa]